MDLHQIDIFCAIIRNKCFSRAAETLFLTRTTASSHMKNFEAELCMQLLDCLGKRAIPADAAEIHTTSLDRSDI